jgi:uncharacterized protein
MKVLTEARQRKLFEEVRRFYESHAFDLDHDINHIVRVMWWVSYLSKNEGANLSIVMPAAMLHDIGMVTGKKKFHAQLSSRMCYRFLKKYHYTDDEMKEISSTILMHSAGCDRSKIRAIETKVLFDADKLDCVNPSGLQRWFSFFASKGYRHHDAVGEILKAIDDWKKSTGRIPFYTRTGKNIGSKGLAYIEGVFNDIIEDYRKFDSVYKQLNLK